MNSVTINFLTKHSARGAGHNVLPIIQFADILPHVGAPDAGVALHVHVVSQGQEPLWAHKEMDSLPQELSSGCIPEEMQVCEFFQIRQHKESEGNFNVCYPNFHNSRP